MKYKSRYIIFRIADINIADITCIQNILQNTHLGSPPAQETYVTRARSPLTLGCCANMLGTNQVFAEVPHLLAEVWLPRLRHAAACVGVISATTPQEVRSGDLGFHP
ncbi:hypothetical protein CsSME_00050316 [Camellia sinensis var. sinensis]